jgi:hypothetical protein
MDEILRKHFSGERISQNLGYNFLKFGGISFWFPRAGGVWGGMRAELFWAGAKNSETTELKLSRSFISLCIVRV